MGGGLGKEPEKEGGKPEMTGRDRHFPSSTFWMSLRSRGGKIPANVSREGEKNQEERGKRKAETIISRRYSETTVPFVPS